MVEGSDGDVRLAFGDNEVEFSITYMSLVFGCGY
jgi:hypothetical protein